MNIKFLSLANVVKALLLIVLIYSVYAFFYSPEQIGINEVTGTTTRLHVSGNTILDAQNVRFIPRSVQYIRVMNDIPNNDASPDISLFYKNNYDRVKVENDFRDMHNLGYNSVRLVFNNSIDTGFYNFAWQSDPKLHSCKEGTNKLLAECVDIVSIDNLVHALRTAESNNLKVILSFIGMNPNAYQTENNKLNNFLYTQAVRDYGRYLKSVFAYLKEKNALNSILAVQPEAEPFLYTNKASVPLKTGDVISSANGYHVTRNHTIDDSFFTSKDSWLGQSSPSVKDLLNDAMVNSFNYWFRAIKEIDPSILTLYDQFPAYNLSTWIDWHADDMAIVNPALEADIIGMQLYPNNLNPTETIASRINFTQGFKEAMNKKPFMIIEYGISKNTSPSEERIPFILNWLKESCSFNISGWSYFNYNENNFSFVTLTQDNSALARSLSPHYLVDPCSSNLNYLPLFSPDSTTAYLVDNGKKYGFPDGDTFKHFGYVQGDQIKVSNAYLSKYTTMHNLTRYIRGTSETAYMMENGTKRQIPNWDTFIAISPPNSTITQLSDELVNSIPTGTPITSTSTTPKTGDLNGDGNVNVFDYVKLLSGYGTLYSSADFAALLSNYGK